MNIDKFRQRFKEKTRLETGFSSLEAVVVVGVLLALAIGGFIAYGSITENAKKAKVRSVASDVYTSAMAKHFDASNKPQDAIDEFNAVNTRIKVKLGDIYSDDDTPVIPKLGEDFCVGAVDQENPEIKASFGKCSDSIVDTPDQGATKCNPLLSAYLMADHRWATRLTPEIRLISAKSIIDPDSATKANNEIIQPLWRTRLDAENALIGNADAIANLQAIFATKASGAKFDEISQILISSNDEYMAESDSLTDYEYNNPSRVQELYDTYVQNSMNVVNYLCS